MGYIDLHCDTLSKALEQNHTTAERLENTMADTERLREAGVFAQFFAMFLPQEKEDAEEEEMAARTEDRMQEMYGIFKNTLAACSGYLAFAGSYSELEQNLGDGKISAFLTVENGDLVQKRMENLDRLYGMGVRLITLTWNDPNCLGYPHSEDPEKRKLGLTAFGRDAVSYMSELGILADVSHLSDQGFYDVAGLVKKPFVASHSNCRALCPASRNLTDEMIRILAEKGGIAGLNLEPSFLNADRRDNVSRIECMCDHIEHFIKVGGESCVGIGTDFDGIEGVFEIGECRKLQLLFDALHRRGISDDVIEKIAWKNAARVIKEGMR